MSAKEQLRAVHAWNKKHAVNTPVIVALDSGEEKKTTTASEAWLLGGHTAVVMLEGVSGCYALAKVQPAKKPA
jgi:hypothetical protein